MLDYRLARSKRMGLTLAGLALIMFPTAAWVLAPAPGNTLFLGAGWISGWWVLSLSRCRLVLFQKQGLYWDGFRHFLLNRGQCRVIQDGRDTLLQLGASEASPTVVLSHLGPAALQEVSRWCQVTSEAEPSPEQPQGSN